MKLAQPDRDTRALEQRKDLVMQKAELRSMCMALDLDKSGTLSTDELISSFSTSKMKAYLATMDLDIRDVELFVGIISTFTDGNQIEIDAFVDSCMKLKGNASTLDMSVLLFNQRTMSRQHHKFQDEVSAAMT